MRDVQSSECEPHGSIVLVDISSSRFLVIQREETKKDSFSEVRFLCSKHLSKQNICVADKPQIICTNIGLLDP